MSKHKVSRGNTSDLIGLWNNRANNVEAAKPNLLSVPTAAGSSTGGSFRFRKTSAFVPAVTITENVKDEAKFRKTSAMVLMPVPNRSKSPNRFLNVDMTATNSADFKPMKTVSGLNHGSEDIPKLRSALKLSTTVAPKIQADNLDENNNSNRRGSVGLGRSKSVCHKVKFQPNQNYESEGKTLNPLFDPFFVELLCTS